MPKRKSLVVRGPKPTPTRPMSPTRKGCSIAVAYRRQTLEEERRFTAALDLLITEWVRQFLGSGGKPK